MKKYDNLQKIQQLDPIKNNWEICHYIAGYDFPWDTIRALELALLKTFCVPSISQLLDQTGQFQHHCQKRYDDTGLLVAEIIKWGYESDRGQECIRRMNYIHSHFPISNADYLYVLSTFIYEPIRWNARFGWRKMCEQERLACFYFWQEVGKRMNIANIPTSYEIFEEYNLNCEEKYFHYSETNCRVANATIAMFLGWFPSFLRPLIKGFVPGLLDERMLRAFGFATPSPLIRHLLESSLKLKGYFSRLLPPRKEPDFYTEASIPSYPQGYELKDLGPAQMLEDLNDGSR